MIGFPPFPPFGGNGFPFTNFHDLNLDWIIAVIKDFYSKYTTIDDKIATGKTELESTYNRLIGLLDLWYNTHSSDIEAELTEAIASFTTQAQAVATTVINSIPQEYTALSRSVNAFVEISANQIITYDYTTKELVFPHGFFCIYNGVPRAIEGPITVNATGHLQSDSCNLWMLSDYSIIAEPFSTLPSNVSARYLGSIYDTNVNINGVSSNFIKLISGDGIYNSVFPNNEGSYISFNHNIRTLVVDNVNKTIFIPVGFRVYKGKTFAYPDDTIHFTDTTASKIWMKNNGVVYCTAWNDNEIWHNDDVCIGFIYDSAVYINGVDRNAISVTETTKANYVYVFGDSIPAGTQTTKTFGMCIHEFNKKIHFLNYAQGSTGYVAEWTGNATKGDGTEGVGTTQALTGNNNVYKQMSAISDTMENILISAGTNDWSIGTSLTTFRNAVENAIDYALSKTPKVFVLLPIKRENWETRTNAISKKLSDYSDVIKEVCIEKGVAYFDGYDVFINPSIATNKNAFAPDGLHPNANGHYRIARAIYETVLEAICK